jgi:hypothetical protein
VSSLQSRVAMAEARGQFRNPKEKERPPLEALTSELVNRQKTEKTKSMV